MIARQKTSRSWSRKAKRSEEERARARANWRSLANRRLLAGLNTRGRVATRQPETKLLKLELDALAASLAAVFEFLPNEGQQRCLVVAKHLNSAMKKLL